MVFVLLLLVLSLWVQLAAAQVYTCTRPSAVNVTGYAIISEVSLDSSDFQVTLVCNRGYASAGTTPIAKACAADGDYSVTDPCVWEGTFLAYWDAGACGYSGDNHWGWCGNESGACVDIVETDACQSGVAVLATVLGNGTCCSSVTVDGCDYAYYATYACAAVVNPGGNRPKLLQRLGR
jgi:hypothetical protein